VELQRFAQCGQITPEKKHPPATEGVKMLFGVQGRKSLFLGSVFVIF